MIHYMTNSSTEQVDYCLLAVVVNRGKAEKVLQLARKKGLTKANCIFAQGRSAAPNPFLEWLALGEVDKEVVLLGIKKQDEEEFISLLDDKLHLCRPHRGIAFTIPIIYSCGSAGFYKSESPYRCAMIILNEDVADEFGDFIREKGYAGLTTIKAKGAASFMHPLMDMKVEPAKALMLMIVHRNKTDRLIELVTERFNLNAENTGVLAVLPINRITGSILEKERRPGQEKEEELPVMQHMVIATVPHTSAEEYMHSVKKLGVSGSTIIHSRFIYLLPSTDILLPFHADAEEKMVITLASRSLARDIRHQLPLIEFKDQVEKPYAISLPVIQTQGVREESGG